MRIKYLLFYSMVAILISAPAVRANFHFGEEPVRPGVSAEKAPLSKEEKAGEKIRAYLTENHINGSVAILKNKKIIFNEGNGFANRETKTPNQPSTTFPIGSITKTIVAAAILQLQEEGKLSIQDPVAKYISDFSNGQRIKIVHLLNHTSGIQRAESQAKGKPGDLVMKTGQKKAKFPPGAQWDYNDMNYMMLGYIIEKATGESLHAYIKSHIFTQAGMEHSGFITPGDRHPFSSEGYIKTRNSILPASRLNPSMLFSCGDIYATALDVAYFDEALLNGRLLRDNSVKEMLKPEAKSNYGLGLYNNGKRIYSRGVVGGWESFHANYPDGTSIVVLENTRDNGRDIKKTADDLYNLVKQSY